MVAAIASTMSGIEPANVRILDVCAGTCPLDDEDALRRRRLDDVIAEEEEDEEGTAAAPATEAPSEAPPALLVEVVFEQGAKMPTIMDAAGLNATATPLEVVTLVTQQFKAAAAAAAGGGATSVAALLRASAPALAGAEASTLPIYIDASHSISPSACAARSPSRLPLRSSRSSVMLALIPTHSISAMRSVS